MLCCDTPIQHRHICLAQYQVANCTREFCMICTLMARGAKGNARSTTVQHLSTGSEEAVGTRLWHLVLNKRQEGGDGEGDEGNEDEGWRLIHLAEDGLTGGKLCAQRSYEAKHGEAAVDAAYSKSP